MLKIVYNIFTSADEIQIHSMHKYIENERTMKWHKPNLKNLHLPKWLINEEKGNRIQYNPSQILFRLSDWKNVSSKDLQVYAS